MKWGPTQSLSLGENKKGWWEVRDSAQPTALQDPGLKVAKSERGDTALCSGSPSLMGRHSFTLTKSQVKVRARKNYIHRKQTDDPCKALEKLGHVLQNSRVPRAGQGTSDGLWD